VIAWKKTWFASSLLCKRRGIRTNLHSDQVFASHVWNVSVFCESYCCEGLGSWCDIWDPLRMSFRIFRGVLPFSNGSGFVTHNGFQSGAIRNTHFPNINERILLLVAFLQVAVSLERRYKSFSLCAQNVGRWSRLRNYILESYRISCTPRLVSFFLFFVRLTIKGGLHFLFFTSSCTSVTGGIMMNRRQL